MYGANKNIFTMHTCVLFVTQYYKTRFTRISRLVIFTYHTQNGFSEVWLHIFLPTS